MRTLTIVLLAMLSILYFPCKTAAQDGKTIYEKRCKTCHGVDSKGSASVAKMTKVDPSMLDLTTDKNKKRTDADLIEIVRKGQGKMKPIPKRQAKRRRLKNGYLSYQNLS